MIIADNVCTGYNGKQVLNNVCATFETGKITVVIGPNGCGKTTLLKSIAGIIPNLSGEIFMDGVNISSIGNKERAKYIAYLSQGGKTPDMTVGEMVLHGRFPYLEYPYLYSNKDKEIAECAMQTMAVCHLSDRKLSTLSGGMRQNAYIARAICQSSQYILLDEPTTYLDISNQKHTMSTLKKLAELGKGIIVVLHDIPLAMEYADSIAVMESGRVVCQSSPFEIFSSGIIDKVFDIELKMINDEAGDIYYYR